MTFNKISFVLLSTVLTACSSQTSAPSSCDAGPGPETGAPETTAPETAGPETSGPETSPPDVSNANVLLAQLTEAKATWTAAKASCPTYYYVSQHQYQPLGGCSKTAVEISQETPTRRRIYTVEPGTCGGGVGPGVLWDETGAAIGTQVGFPSAWTVEELFADCEKNLSSSDPAKNRLELRVGPMGVPMTCGHTPKNCADDCFIGFDLGTFVCGALPLTSAPEGGTSDADGGNASGGG